MTATTISRTHASEMLLAAVEALLADDGFSVTSTLSENAVTSAILFRSWGNANKMMFENVATEIVCDLEAIFTKHSSTLRLKVQREKMWGYYHIVRSSLSFTQKWLNVLRMIPGCKSSPIFYQYLTDNIFRQLIKIKFPTDATVQPANTYSVDLTFEEASALRYAAGYVCRALKKKFAADSELVECIDELVKDESDEGPDSTSEWTQLASRGGLVHISDSTYRVFHAMELVVRQRFQKGSVNPHPRNKK